MLKDLAFIQDPDNWPRWPVLPLRRKSPSGGFPEAGFILPEQPVVYLANIFDKEALKNLRDVPKLTYNSFSELLVDGWQVD